MVKVAPLRKEPPPYRPVFHVGVEAVGFALIVVGNGTLQTCLALNRDANTVSVFEGSL